MDLIFSAILTFGSLNNYGEDLPTVMLLLPSLVKYPPVMLKNSILSLGPPAWHHKTSKYFSLYFAENCVLEQVTISGPRLPYL